MAAGLNNPSGTPGMYGDYPIELINQMIGSGKLNLPGPDGKPIVKITPDGRPLNAQQLGDLGMAVGGDISGTKQIDADKVLQGMEDDYADSKAGRGKYAPAPIPDAPEDPRNARFGDDMDWLDEAFQQKAPTREQALSLGTTGDESARNAQAAAMDELFGIYKQGGNTAQDRAARSKARGESEDWLRGQREADMQNLAERGMSGSGAELATLLGDRQNAATRLSSADQTASADAEKRALDALMGGEKIGENIRQGADDYTKHTSDLVADIAAMGTKFLQDSYTHTQDARNRWGADVLTHQVGAAQGKATQDQRDQIAGFGQAAEVGAHDADALTNAQTNKNVTKMGAFTGYTPPLNAIGQQTIGQAGATAGGVGAGLDDIVNKGVGYASSGAANVAAGSSPEEQKK